MSKGDRQDPEGKGLLGGLLGGLGLGKAPTKPALRTPMGSDHLRRTGEGARRGSSGAPKTAPLSDEDRARQSEERRYLISAYEVTPGLIPEFQNPHYMYKLISNERDHIQDCLSQALAQKKRRQNSPDASDPAAQQELALLDEQIQGFRNDLARLFGLIKRVAGVPRSGTGGTDFLDPLKR
ncbi:MAG: hypothetical protein KGR26_05175 [Cyanobacteria bacterium REEB65]|nr:hypothetical protein [Cyanobacteria bacterium REEB65]